MKGTNKIQENRQQKTAFAIIAIVISSILLGYCFHMMHAAVFSALTTDSISSQTVEENEQDGTQLANPFVDCDTMQQAKELAGFDVQVDGSIGKTQQSAIRVMNGELVELQYAQENGKTAYCIRKAPGTEDIGGYYGTGTAETVKCGNKNVQVMKETAGVKHVFWTDGEYTYSILFEIEVSEEQALSLIETIH